MPSRAPKKSLQQPKQQPIPLLKRIWRNSQTLPWAYTQLSGASILAAIDATNRVLQSQQMTDVLNRIHATPEIYTALAMFGLITFIAHGRDNA